MRPLGILTDSSVYFARPHFFGEDLVSIFSCSDAEDALTARFVPALRAMLPYYRHVLVVLRGAALSPLVQEARKYVEEDRLSARVIVIDSGTFSFGMGLLVQHAAAKAAADPNIDHKALAIHIRRYAAGMYTLLAVPDFDFLARRGLLSEPQKIVAQILGFIPVFSMERGRLSLLEKTRSMRQVCGVFQEFLDEFESLAYLGYFPSLELPSAQVRAFRAFLSENFPNISVYTLTVPSILQRDLGHNVCGLIAMERRFL